MKGLIKELVAEKGRELTVMGIAILLVAAGIIAFHFYSQGGDSFVPEEVTSNISKIEHSISRGINIMEDAADNLNELFDLEKGGNTSEITQKISTYKSDLAKMREVFIDVPGDLQAVDDQISQIRPRIAGKPLSEALNAAAQVSIELLRLREDTITLYDGLGARIRGEETKGYNLIVDRATSQG
ncbi:MAG: hypothetical protein NUV96_00025, partial [Candidatus Colwellbacteria bacterium]|nr:hypothetical protein [Candidatus Colwellbacteria bacterium]